MAIYVKNDDSSLKELPIKLSLDQQRYVETGVNALNNIVLPYGGWWEDYELIEYWCNAIGYMRHIGAGIDYRNKDIEIYADDTNYFIRCGGSPLKILETVFTDRLGCPVDVHLIKSKVESTTKVGICGIRYPNLTQYAEDAVSCYKKKESEFVKKLRK